MKQIKSKTTKNKETKSTKMEYLDALYFPSKLQNDNFLIEADEQSHHTQIDAKDNKKSTKQG